LPPEDDALSTGRAHGTSPHRSGALGVLYIVASGVCFGAMPIFGRFAYRDGVDPPTLLLLRFSIAAAILWGAFLAKRATLPRAHGLAMLVGMGAVGYAGQAFSYFTALTLASAGLVALLLYTYPALVALLSRAVLGHELNRLQLVGIATALTGSALTIGRAGDGSALGVFFALLGAVIYSGYILIGSRLPSDVTPLASSTVVISSAALVFGAAAAVRGAHFPATAVGWVAVLGVAVIGTVLAISFFFAGLERMGPVRASIYSTVEPVCTLVLAAVVLGEQVTILRVLGGVLILGTVVLLARADRPV
jgi:drug/metabolite transporter (DMT)-like permease